MPAHPKQSNNQAPTLISIMKCFSCISARNPDLDWFCFPQEALQSLLLNPFPPFFQDTSLELLQGARCSPCQAGHLHLSVHWAFATPYPAERLTIGIHDLSLQISEASVLAPPLSITIPLEVNLPNSWVSNFTVNEVTDPS